MEKTCEPLVDLDVLRFDFAGEVGCKGNVIILFIRGEAFVIVDRHHVIRKQALLQIGLSQRGEFKS